MNEKIITKLSLIIIVLGLILFLVFYENEFSLKTISEMKQNIGSKGIVVGKVDYIINYEPLIFFLKNDEKIKVFYPKKIDLEKDDIVEVYGETKTYNNEIEIFAQKVIPK